MSFHPAASAAGQPGVGAPPCAPPLSTLVAPQTVLPPNSCDAHLHILGPSSTYPYSPERIYTPSDCLLPQYLELSKSLGLTRCVIVQPSVYGLDNTVLLKALGELGDAARGVVVVDDRIGDVELAEMHAAGVRGARVNLVDVASPGQALPIESLLRLEERIAHNGWHIELLIHADEHPGLYEQLRKLHTPVVFGHMGYVSHAPFGDEAGFQGMLSLMEEGRAWAKLSGPYRVGSTTTPHLAAEVARALVAACPHRLVWGSDWPHVMVRGAMPHAALLLDNAADWIGTDLLHAVFVDNPSILYGWPPST